MACFTAITPFSVPFLLFAWLACVAGFVQALNSPSDLLNGRFNSMNAPVVGRHGSEVWDVVVSPPAAAAGLGACWTRSLAFKDGRGQDLQIRCGVYSQSVLQELDLIISEARENGNRRSILYLRLYVRRPTDPGVDAFHTNLVVISEFKKQIEAVLTSINIVAGVAYRDEPAVMGLKLMVSLHPQGGPPDPGKLTFSGWIQNMASFVKSIDRNHLLTMGLEENGGSDMPPKKARNPRYQRRFLSHEESPPSSLVEVSHVKAAVPPSHPSGCTKIPSNAPGHCPND